MDFSIFSNSWNKWNIDSWMLAQVVLPNFFQFTKSSKSGILDLLTFIFCQIVRIIFHAWYVRLDCQFSKKEMFIFMSTEVLRILFPTWIKGKKCKISLGVQMQIVNKLIMGWGFKCNLLCLWIYIIDIGTRYIPNMKSCSVSLWYQNRNKPDKKCSRGIYLSLYSIYI